MKKLVIRPNLIILIFCAIFVALLFSFGIFTFAITHFDTTSDNSAEAYTTGGTAIGTADALKGICRANQSGTYYLSSDITWTSAGYNQSCTFSGTLYGNGKTITISTGNISQTQVGDNVNIGMLFSVLSGTIRDCTIVVKDATKWYEYTGSGTTYTDYAGVVCGKLDGGSIINVNISIANGKGLSFYAEDDSSTKGGGYGCIVGAYAGHTAGTSTIKNCTLTLNGGIWGKSEDFDGNGDQGSGSRCHVGGFVGEVDESTKLNMYNNRFVGSSTGIVGSGLINSDSDHRSGRTGGIVGVVRSSATCTINALLYEFNGSVHCFRDRDTKCGLIIGFNWGTCNVSNIVVPSNVTTTRDEGNEGDGGNPAYCFSASSITSTAKVSHSGAIGDGSAKAGTNVTISNSITYNVNAFLGSNASSDYGTFKLAPYIDASGSTGGWNATVTPKSGYCVSDIKYGSTYDNSYTTKRDNATAFTLWVSSSCTAYAGYVAQQSSTITYTRSNKSGPYDGTGWDVKAEVSIASKNYALNFIRDVTTWYYHSQNANGGEVTYGKCTDSTTLTTSKNVGVYTMALRTGTGANASMLASGTCVYRDSANAPTKVGYYGGQTATCTITKREISLSITNNMDSEYKGQSTQTARSKIYITNLVGSEALRFYVTKQAKTFSSSSSSSGWEENNNDYTSYGFSTAGDYWHRTNNTYIYFCAYDAGSYSMKIIGFGDATNGTGGLASNYTWNASYDTEAERTSTFTINKKALSVTKDTTGQSFTYNGDRVASNWENRASLSVNGLVSGDTIYFWFNDYSTVSLDDTVYFIRDNDTGKKYQYPLNHGYTGKISGKTCGDYYTLDGTNHQLLFCAKNAGTYTITLYGMTQGNNSTAPTNYTWASDSDTDAERTITFTVVPKEISLTSTTNNTNLTYRGTPTKDNFGSEYAVCWKVNGLVGSEFLNFRAKYQSGIWVDASNNGSYLFKMTETEGFNRNNNSIYFTADNAGTYSATIYDFIDDQDSSHSSDKKGFAKNYKWSASYDTEEERTVSFTIAKKEVTLSWSNTSFTYDKSSHAPTCTAGSLISGDSCTVNVSGAQTNAGTNYTATASSLSNGNYKLPSATTQSFTINKKALSVTKDTTGQSYTYNGDRVASNWQNRASISVNGLMSGDTVYFWCSDYSTVSLDDTVYFIRNNDTGKKYEYPLNHGYTGKISGKTCGDYYTLDGTNHQLLFCAKNVGTYTVILYGMTQGNNSTAPTNYTWASDSDTDEERTVTFTVVQKEATLSWGTSSFTYNKTAQKPSCSVSNIASGDTCTVMVTGEQTNVGSYTATASSLSNGNYKLPSATTQSFTINKKTVSLSWGTTTFTYNGASQVPTCTAGSVCSGDTCTVTVSGAQTNAGTNYTATASSLSNGNYALPSTKTTAFSISQKEVSLAWDITLFTYDRTSHTPSCSAGGLVSNDTCTVTVTGGQTNVGKYTATATDLSNANYKFPSTTTTSFTIEAKTVTLSWGTSTFTYNGTTQVPACTAGSVCSGDTCTVTVTGGQTNVGIDYTATASSLSNANYALPSSDTTISFTIHQKEVTLSWGTTTFTYDKTSHLPTCTAGSLVTNDTCTVTVTGKQTNVGDYTATASSLSNGNYKLPSITTQSFTINKKTVSLSWGTTTFTYNGASQVPTCTAGSVCSGDTCTVSVSGAKINAGNNYTATASSLSDDNYALPSAKTTTFTIQQKEVTLAWGTSSFTYDKTSHAPTCTAGSLILGDDCTVTVTGEMSNVGTYTATASSLSDGNYKLPSANTKEFGIVAKEVSLSWGESTFTYDKTEKIPTCTAGELCDGDDCTVTVTGEKTNVGTYTATASSLSNENYKLPSTKTKEFTIQQKEALLSWGKNTFTYNKTAQKPTCSVSNLCTGDACTVTVTGEGTTVGDYTATATDLSNGNYVLSSSTSKDFSIVKKEATLSWGETSFIFSGTAQKPTCSVTNLCTGDTCTVNVSGAKTNVGNYTATAVSLSDDNYKLPSSVTKDFSIAKKEVTLSWDNLTFTYDKTAKKPTCEAGALCSGDSCTVTVMGEQTNAGTYTATASSLNNTNYKLPSANTEEFTILQKEVTLSWGTTTFTYNKTAQKPTCTAGALCSGDTCSVTVTGEQTIAGTYTATASSLSDGNYKLPSATTTSFTIQPKTASLSWGISTFTYDNTEKLPSCSVDNLCDNDTCSVTVTGTQTNAGNYTATASSLSNGNYALPSSCEKQFTIQQATYDVSGITFENKTFVYDGASHSLVIGGTLPTGLDGITLTVSYEGSATDVDDGKVTCKAIFATTSTNYVTPSKKQATVEILAKEISILWCEDDFTYNGAEQQVTASYQPVLGGERSLAVGLDGTFDVYVDGGYTAMVSFAELDNNYKMPAVITKTYHIKRKSILGAQITLSGDLTYNGSNQTKAVTSVIIDGMNATFDVSGNMKKNAGDYTLSITGNGNFEGTETREFSIAKKDVTVTAQDVEIAYGKNVENNGVIFSGLVGQEKLDGSVDFDYTYTQYGDIGTYSLMPKGYSSDNYNIGYVAGVFTVIKKEISITITANGGAYGSVTPATASFDEDCIENDDDISIHVTYFGTTNAGTAYAETSTVPTEAGSYTVRASIDTTGKAQNYSLPSTTTLFTIEKAEYDIDDVLSFDDDSFTYDGTSHTLAVTVKKDSEIIVSYTNNGRTDIGSQEVTVSFSGYSLYNYNEIDDMTATLAVTALSIEDAVVTLGEDLIYNGSEQTKTVVSVQVGALFATFDVSGNKQTNADAYTLTITGNGNFAGEITREYTIQKLNISGAEITLGATLTYNGAEQTQTIVSVIKDGLNVTYDLTDNAQTNVSVDDYVLTITAKGNFEGTITKEWNILPKNIEGAFVTLGDLLTYNGEEQTQAVVSVQIDSLSATFDVSGNKQKNAGDYTLTVTAKGNFVGSVTKEYSIYKKELSITAENKSIVYGQSPIDNGVSYVGFVTGENEQSLQGELLFDFTYSQYQNVGNYDITPKGYTSDNYDITFVKGELTVTKFVTSLTWGNNALYYNGTSQAPTCTALVLNNDTCTVTLSGYGTSAGNYTATAIGLTNNNYALPEVTTYDYKIIPYAVTKPTASTKTYVYSGEEQTYEFGQDDDQLYYSVTSNKRTKSGTQTVTVSLLDKVNSYWKDESYSDLEFEFIVQKLVLTEPTVTDLVYTGESQTASVADANLNKYFEITENNGGTNVGNYVVKLSLTDEDCAWQNTEGILLEIPYNILQAQNSWTASPSVGTITYGETLTFGATSTFGTVKCLFKKTNSEEEFSETIPTNAGTYTILFTVEGTENYLVLNKQINFTIQKASFDVSQLTWVTTSVFIYDGEPKSVYVVGIPENVTAVYTDNEKTEAGEYVASVTFEYDTENYNEVSLPDFNWSISDKSIIVLWVEGTYTYDGTIFALPRAYYVDDEQEIDLPVSEVNQKVFQSAGSYEFVASFDDPRFLIKNSHKIYSIARKKIDKPAEDTTIFYCTGAEQKYNVEGSSIYSIGNNIRKDAGTQDVIVHLTDNNYEWADGTTKDITFKFTIQHRFSEHNGDASRVLREATCTKSTVYTAVCVCGATEEYSYGEPLGHDYKASFEWNEKEEATAIIACSRCNFTDRKTCEVITMDEDFTAYLYATVTYGDKTFNDKKLKGDATYEDDIYPVWRWSNNKGVYQAQVSFTSAVTNKVVDKLNADVKYTDEEKTFTVIGTVVYGNDNVLYTNSMVVNKVLLTVRWEENKYTSHYLRPYETANSILTSRPTDERKLLGFKTSSGVYLPYENGSLIDYSFIKAETLTALYQQTGSVVLSAVDQDGEKLNGIFFELTTEVGTKYEGTVSDFKPVTFKNVPYGIQNLKASFVFDGKQIERTFIVDVNADTVEKEIVLTQSKVNTQVKGEVRCENLENIVVEEKENTTSTIVLDTTKTPDEEIVEKMNKIASSEANEQELVQYFDLAVLQITKTVEEGGKVEEKTEEIKSAEEPIKIKMEVPDSVYQKLLKRNGSPSDIVVYLYDEEEDTSKKLPKEEFAHDSNQYYSVEIINSKPYILLSVNSFGAFAIGIQEKIEQKTNEIISLSIQNWVYGTTASVPVSTAKYGTVKYLFAKKGEEVFTETVPVNAGTYLLKAYVEAEEGIVGIEKIIEFTIEKATYNLAEILFKDRTVVGDGTEFSLEINGSLPEGVYVVYESNSGSIAGQYSAVAHFYGDNENYNLIPDKTATLTIEDRFTWILTNFWWAFAVAGFALFFIIGVFIARGRMEHGGKGLMFNYRLF